jgi:adenine deaminase
VRGVAEVMDMHGVLHGSERMQEIVQAGLNSGKLIEGHARGLSGADLQAYLAAGVTSDHELTSADDALEKLRAGLTIEIRGSHPYLLPDIVAALKTLPHLSSQITVCTDDVPPDMLLEKGGIIALLNLLIEHGLPATDVLRFATLNAAIRLQRHDLGLIAAGAAPIWWCLIPWKTRGPKSTSPGTAGPRGRLLSRFRRRRASRRRAIPCRCRRSAR